MNVLLDIVNGENYKKHIYETKDVFRLNCIQYDYDFHKKLLEIIDYIKQNNLGELTAQTVLGDTIDFENEFQQVNSGEINLKINKEGEYYFLTEKFFNSFLYESKEFQNLSTIRLLFIDKEFKSLSLNFIPFNEILETQKPLIERISAIKFIKAKNVDAQNFMANYLENWITKEEFYESCCNSWKIISTQKLITLIGSEFSIENDLFKIEFRGERRRTLIFERNNDKIFVAAFVIIHQIALWIYFQTKDIDSRLTLFNQQFSSLLEEDETELNEIELIKKLRNAYENSQLSYRYYLSNSSKELQKTLNDLNKTLFEYTSKIRQNSSDLANTLWKDFTTSLGVMILNFAIKKQEIVGKYFSLFAISLCVYVIISLLIGSFSSFWFYYSLKKNLNSWRTKLYSYLNEDEYNTFAIIPLKKAFNVYISVFVVVLLAYITLVYGILSISEIIKTNK